jgi:hypothetical protein
VAQARSRYREHLSERRQSVSRAARAETMKIGVNLTEEEAEAFKARKELELASMCGGEWCVDVYRSGGR